MRNRPLWLIPVILLCCAMQSEAQFWTPVEPQNIPSTGKRDIIPQAYQTYFIDDQSMKSILWKAPHEYVQTPANSDCKIIVALGDGSADIFRMVQYEMMEAELAAQYTGFKTFRGVSVSNPYRTIRADWTQQGFRAVIRDLDGITYIDPYQRNDLANRIVYYKRDYIKNEPWACGVVDEDIQGGVPYSQRAGDCQFRSMRLALATTGEYSNYFGATSSAQSAIVMSQVVTAINRVNQVYEADLALRLILVGNTNQIFYYDPASDPYTNNNGSTMLGQNQTTCDGVIGSANYDIGHVFSTGGGGVAYLGCICNNSLKAGGVTGSSAPVGDPFVIDYVAHEMGHQCGGDHTFNGTVGSCGGGNRSPLSAYEPGSGTTIMAYAGICGSQDIQPHSDDYFHARSLQQIKDKLLSVNCPAFISFVNDAPVATSIPDYTIPISTPFVLTASATDANSDPISYCWEEYDLEGTSTDPPTSTDIDGPMFRTFDPVASSSRYFPRLQDLVQNISPTWEVLPSVSRTMTFRMTVRDYHAIAGCSDEDDVVVTTSSTSGPFVVTSQSSSTNWNEYVPETITWDVANTTAAPVSCANVDIRFSTDGGLTYPTALLLNTPNDGSAVITVPVGTTTTGRVMVKGSNNVFFDINNTNITVNPVAPNFTLNLNPQAVSECNDGTVQTTVEVGSYTGFNDPVTLSVLNLPPGATATFSPQVVIPGNNSTLTISNLTGLFGNYSPTVRGTSTTGNKNIIFSITLIAPMASAPTLISPANNAVDAMITPLLDWQSIAGITQYEFQIAYDNAFTQIALSGIVNADQYQTVNPLIVGQQYYWRVRGINTCGNGTWSSTRSFTTISCFSRLSTNVPVAIPGNGTPTVMSTLYTPVDMLINDVNVVSLTGTHTYVDDLKFSLLTPDNATRLIWNQPCTSQDNFNINFDDEAYPGTWPCPPTDGLTYRPSNTLSFFDGKFSKGTWTMKVQDVANGDGGSLDSWGIKVCGDLQCQPIVYQTSGTGVGSLPAAVACSSPGDTIRLAGILTGQTIDVGATPLLLNKNLVIMAEAGNINITCSGTRVFDIPAGVQVKIQGAVLTAGTSLTGGVFNNAGMVTIADVITHKNPSVNGASLIQNTPGAQLIVTGNCLINQ